MENQPNLSQDPICGHSAVMYCGDCLTLRLTLSFQTQGTAYVRTNLGAASVTRQEIIRRVEKDEIKLNEAWIDIAMVQETDLTFLAVLPLTEVGHFQAKCFFLPRGSSQPLWPPGENIVINVEPAGTCCANIIYNAFVRQFGPNKYSENTDPETQDAVSRLDKEAYTVIPKSGKFRDLVREIPFIFDQMGCRVLHLLPIHPTPTTYARMGRFGSPYAALNFTDVDPALAEFDPSVTPLEQFLELVDAVHAHNGYLFMDIAINHTGWAASIHESHPHWLSRDEAGKIEVPGAWGVEWADLTKLDYSNQDLWTYMADVFLLWCRRGVDGYRCDAGYMIPVEAWEYIVARVRQEYPDTLFFLEGLGGPVRTTRKILGPANFNWAYSELFQNYAREQISDYLPLAYEISHSAGHMVHFAETHDNNRLASESRDYSRMRTALCALFSTCGGFGFANGVEWFATDKINVHESRSLNWGSKNNQVAHITRLNRILARHPAFFSGTRLSLISKNDTQGLVLLRHHLASQKKIIVLINLDCERHTNVGWHCQTAGLKNTIMVDLLSGDRINTKSEKDFCRIKLNPAQVLVLSPDLDDTDLLEPDYPGQQPKRVYQQKLKAKALAAWTVSHGYGDVSKLDLADKARQLGQNPLEFVRSINHQSSESRVIVIHVNTDTRREVMVPPGFFILVKSHCGFRAQLQCARGSSLMTAAYEEGLPMPGNRSFFALFTPISTPGRARSYTLKLRLFDTGGTVYAQVPLLFLTHLENLRMSRYFTRKEIISSPFLKILGTTCLGGMMRAAAWWGRLDSRYDGLLGANMDPAIPENRWMVLSRYRIWAVFQGYSRELVPDCLERFSFSYTNGGQWTFHVPTSEGKCYSLTLHLVLDPTRNKISLTIRRGTSKGETSSVLEDDRPVTVIIRPDIEDRGFHETVKAYTGPETDWPKRVKTFQSGFSFKLSNGRYLGLGLSKGDYVSQPEWQYMVHRPIEADRGLDPDSDLFSPGYLTFEAEGGESVELLAEIRSSAEPVSTCTGTVKPYSHKKNALGLLEALKKSLDAFIVNREKDKSVIAGYPWFLDWGRDSLIFCRALIELKRFADARKVIQTFGRFENQGTLPNMIQGKDAGNIETSDAPLWLVACCRDLIKKEDSDSFLDEKLENRSVRNILISIGESLIKGSPTGVKADPDSALLYSPSHFTWMDTNFPAGSPRQGYPIEIQALWVNALLFLAQIDPENDVQWMQLADQARASIIDLFFRPDPGYFSDCLHCDGPTSARTATPDDALRPNQLFLFSLDILKDTDMGIACVESCLELLVPGGIRSLADRKVEYPLHIFYNDRVINDPEFPYFGTYKGDEDTRRKPAYHNGTAWTWPFPVFCEAWANVFGPAGRPAALAWLGSVLPLMRKGAAGYLPEILDGDYPHTPRGCDAQAWGVSEAARVISRLS